MSEELDNLVGKAEESITNVFSERSVPQSETATVLRELQGFINTMLDALE